VDCYDSPSVNGDVDEALALIFTSSYAIMAIAISKRKIK